VKESERRKGFVMAEKVVVAGLGEVGRPLLYILSRRFDCAGIDVEPVLIKAPCSVLHICYPSQIGDFVAVTADYIQRLRPALTIIHSTVPPGTTRKIQAEIGDSNLAYSPVRGKHARMEEDMLRYRKFVAAPRQAALEAALEHLSQAGFRTTTLPSPELAELAKVLETTYLGVLIAWTQEMERLAARYGGTFSDVNRFIEDVDYLPSHIFPGVIGGHCVLPNIKLLQTVVDSQFLDLVVKSNLLKAQLPEADCIGEMSDENRTDRIGVLGA
jgi:UDP-N-acetyl-D-mannosaminuronate dehydrogenase